MAEAGDVVASAAATPVVSWRVEDAAASESFGEGRATERSGARSDMMRRGTPTTGE